MYSIGLLKFKIIHLSFSLFFLINYIYYREVNISEFCEKRTLEEKEKDNIT